MEKSNHRCEIRSDNRNNSIRNNSRTVMQLTPLHHDDVKLLIVHCSATRCDRDFPVKNLMAVGIAKFGQPSYHWYIRRNGNLVPILPESVRGAHARGYNRCSLGICYEGGVKTRGKNDDTRTPQQKATLYALLKQLRRDYPQARIIGHKELPHVIKDCPGFTPSTEYADLQP